MVIYGQCPIFVLLQKVLSEVLLQETICIQKEIETIVNQYRIRCDEDFFNFMIMVVCDNIINREFI